MDRSHFFSGVHNNVILLLQVTFLEFFEALLQCAWQWYSRRVSLNEQESLVDGVEEVCSGGGGVEERVLLTC